MNEWELTTEEIEQARDYGEYEYEDDTLEVGLFVDDFTDQAGTEHATFGEPKHLMALAASLNANPDMRASRTKFQRRFYGDAPMLGMVNNGVPK